MIWIPWHDGLGDLWASTSYLLGLSIREHGRVQVQRVNGMMVDEIYDVLDSPGKLHMTDTKGDVELEGAYIWHAPYAPTRLRWHPHAGADYFCYQFDGVSLADEKNPNLVDAENILNAAEAVSGLPGIRLGKHLGIHRCVELLSQAAFFVGCDSGISHMVHSVGTPCFLLRYKVDPHTCHHGKAYFECRGVDGFREQIRGYYRCVAETDPRRGK
jgi:hypothetical protein